MSTYTCIMIINTIGIELLNDYVLYMNPDPSGNMGQNNFGGDGGGGDPSGSTGGPGNHGNPGGGPHANPLPDNNDNHHNDNNVPGGGDIVPETLDNDGLRDALDKLKNNSKVKPLGNCGLTRQECADLRHTVLAEHPDSTVRRTLQYYSDKQAYLISNSQGIQYSIMRILHIRGA